MSRHVEYQLIGAPGAGKTTTLANVWLPRAVQRWGAASVAVCSLTRTAAAEIASRNSGVPKEAVGTLHALAWRALDRPEVAEGKISEWNAYAPSYALSGAASNLDEPDADHRGGSPGDEAMAACQVLRHRRFPRHLWPERLRAFQKEWSFWCGEAGLTDFTGLIEEALERVDSAPGAPRVLVVDEVQDCSALEMALVRKWAQSAEYVVLAGDPWQCQPGDTMVETSAGRKRIDQLDPGTDRLVGFDRRASSILRSVRFSMEKHVHRGDMFTVGVGSKSTRATPEHIWTVKMVRPKGGKHVSVYLMRKGDRWRVGTALMFRAGDGQSGVMGFRFRTYTERADATWILQVCENRESAMAVEQIVSLKYGIPSTTWTSRTPEIVEEIYSKIPTPRAHECLRDFGRDARFPFFQPDLSKGREKYGVRVPLTVRSCNLIPEFMQVPVPTGGKLFAWEPISSIEREDGYIGEVVSLQVDREHYVADGIVTHNCIYQWRGADSGAFTSEPVPEENKRFLSQSYRCPRAVHVAAMGLVRKAAKALPHKFEPRDFDGRLARIPAQLNFAEEVVRSVRQDGTTMLLATCGFHVAQICTALRNAGIPFHNPYRTTNGRWNPLRGGASRISSFLRPCAETHGDDARLWTWKELHAWVEMCQARELLNPKSKEAIRDAAKAQKGDGNALTSMEMQGLFDTRAWESLSAARAADRDRDAAMLSWLKPRMLNSWTPKVDYALRVAEKRGSRALVEEPKCAVGTIHSVKGGQSDRVVVFPDLSFGGMREWTGSSEQRDAILRLFYVAFTRAREELLLASPSSANHIGW